MAVPVKEIGKRLEQFEDARKAASALKRDSIIATVILVISVIAFLYVSIETEKSSMDLVNLVPPLLVMCLSLYWLYKIDVRGLPVLKEWVYHQIKTPVYVTFYSVELLEEVGVKFVEDRRGTYSVLYKGILYPLKLHETFLYRTSR